MVRIVVGQVIRIVPERVARIITALIAKAERIEAAHTGGIAIHWAGNSVQAKLSENIDVPRLPSE